MFSPLLRKSQCKELFKSYSVLPVAKQYSLNFDTSLSVFLKLEGDFLLESAESGETMGRYSFIGKGVYRKFVLYQDTVEDWGLANTSAETRSYDKVKLNVKKQMHNPIEYVQEVMRSYKAPFDELYLFPPFWGGLVGYLGYETIGYYEDIERLNEKEGLDVPDGILVIPEQLLVIDHLKRILWIVSPIEHIDEYDAVYESVRATWSRINEELPKQMQQYNKYLADLDDIEVEQPIVWESSLSQSEFEDKVRYCKECIERGDVIQVVFSRQVKASFEREKELLFYIRLRNVNPSPYMYFLKFEDFSIVGSSPEVMTSLDIDGTMRVRPIAGTIRRGNTLEEDIKMRKELISDEKERAEHIMLVDLGRNDLHRLAIPATVQVKDYMRVDGYSHVFHIVSTIEGKIEEGKDAFDLIRATFPAGTLSGAPKIEAMNIIGRTEPSKRNIYAGAVMVLGFNGYLDSCIIIRTAVIKDNTIYLQAGAGLVADSVPEKEWKETDLKLGALMHTVEIIEAQSQVVQDNDDKEV